MKQPEGDRLDDAMDLLANDSWREVNRPALGAEQLAYLLVLLEPWFREEFAPRKKLPTVPKEYQRPKLKTWADDVMSQAQARRLVRERSGGICEVCGVAKATNYQHRKGKAHCGPAEMWIPSNGLDVCGHGNVSGCHGLIHQNPKAAVANGWTVPSWGDPKSTAVFRLSQLVLLDDEGSWEPVESEVA